MEYNGYSNCPTWIIKAWIDNDEALYNYWQEAAAENAGDLADRLQA